VANLKTDSDKLNQAILKFVGYGITPNPEENSSRLLNTFGPELATQLENEVTLLLNELDQLKPDWATHSLITAGAWAREKIYRRHPELDSKALDALEWTYTWWYK
jgi:hypothetical protein